MTHYRVTIDQLGQPQQVHHVDELIAQDAVRSAVKLEYGPRIYINATTRNTPSREPGRVVLTARGELFYLSTDLQRTEFVGRPTTTVTVYNA